MTFWRLHYHLIWATHDRQPSITQAREKLMYGVFYQKSKELGFFIHAAGNVDDHVHLVVSIPPQIAVAECVRQLKGASSYAINHHVESDGQFKWQGGYAALTISESMLETVIAYVSKQKEHHQHHLLDAIYEQIDEHRAV
jgi:REP element-mobilizing transposase RayT